MCIASNSFCSMKATCIEARNHKIERIVFINLDQFDIHVKVDQKDLNMIMISIRISIPYTFKAKTKY